MFWIVNLLHILSQNSLHFYDQHTFVVTINSFDLLIFLGWKAVSAIFFAFWRYFSIFIFNSSYNQTSSPSLVTARSSLKSHRRATKDYPCHRIVLSSVFSSEVKIFENFLLQVRGQWCVDWAGARWLQLQLKLHRKKLNFCSFCIFSIFWLYFSDSFILYLFDFDYINCISWILSIVFLSLS